MARISHGKVADQKQVQQDFDLLQGSAMVLLNQDGNKELRLMRMDVVSEQFALTIVHFSNGGDGSGEDWF